MKDSVDVAAIIHGIEEETAEAFAAKKMRLDPDIPDRISLTGDRDLIYSIFKNLTDNALKYASEGATVKVSAWKEPHRWCFSFADDGPGVPEESLPRLFDRFYRVDKGRSRELGGTGLGLSIVKEAILLHGGEIKATAVKPHGLRYDFSLSRPL